MAELATALQAFPIPTEGTYITFKARLEATRRGWRHARGARVGAVGRVCRCGRSRLSVPTSDQIWLADPSASSVSREHDARYGASLAVSAGGQTQRACVHTLGRACALHGLPWPQVTVLLSPLSTLHHALPSAEHDAQGQTCPPAMGGGEGCTGGGRYRGHRRRCRLCRRRLPPLVKGGHLGWTRFTLF